MSQIIYWANVLCKKPWANNNKNWTTIKQSPALPQTKGMTGFPTTTCKSFCGY